MDNFLECFKPFFISLFFFFSPPSLQANDYYDFSFSTGHEGWVGEFADYPIGEEQFFELGWGWSNLPYLEASNKGMFLTGNNHSDDLLMLLKKQLVGLVPNTEYDIHFEITIETNVPPNQMGIGGSPGESVFVKVGASIDEPIKVAVGNNYRLNIDVGSQSNDGKNGVVIGNLAKTSAEDLGSTFSSKKLKNDHALKATTDDSGNLWVFVGTDSGFEGKSHYYLSNISMTLENVPPQ